MEQIHSLIPKNVCILYSTYQKKIEHEEQNPHCFRTTNTHFPFPKNGYVSHSGNCFYEGSWSLKNGWFEQYH